MFFRNILNELRQWANKTNRKPLILRGARQVGKTTVIEIFSKEFSQYIYLNLEKTKDRKIFEHNLDVNELIDLIFLNKNCTRNKSIRTLIFIDEIQNCPPAIILLRYFYESANDLHVIAAGSLLEVVLDKKVSFPVGRVEYLFMYPLTFNEFLFAIKETEALKILHTYPVQKFAHNKLLELFHRYTLLGGMPEIIAQYCIDNNISHLTNIYRNLIIAYMDDVEKYARNLNMTKIIRHAIEHAPFSAGRRIKFHGFGQSNYGSREMSEALTMLERAMLIKLVYPTTVVQPPVLPNYKKSPKLFFLDCGLINYCVGLQKYYFTINDLTSFYQGIMAECIVAQELQALNIFGNGQLHFWVREKKQSNSEVDFLLQHNHFLIPIEVKSGKSGTLRSLHQFIEQTNHNYAVRLYSGPIQIDQAQTSTGKKYTLLSLPYYLTSQLVTYVEQAFFT